MGAFAGAVALSCAFGGALLGVFVGSRLPLRHRSPETKDVVRLGMGMVATITALVLGLLIASAKSYYDGQGAELAQVSANVVMLDRLLRHYGREADDGRVLLRASVDRALESLWPNDRTKADLLPPAA